MSVMQDLIAALKAALKRGDITMSALAKQAGCSRQHLYGVFEGRHNLSLQMAEELAGVIGFELVMKKLKKKISA